MAFVDTTERILQSLAQMHSQRMQSGKSLRSYFDLVALAQTNVNRIEASSLPFEDDSLIARVIEEGSVYGWLSLLETETQGN